MNSKRFLLAWRIIPILLALIAWTCVTGTASAHQGTGTPGTTTTTTQTTPPSTTTTTTVTGCTAIETYVSQILALFGATAIYKGCSAPPPTSTGGTGGTTTGGTGGTTTGGTGGTTTGGTGGTTTGGTGGTTTGGTGGTTTGGTGGTTTGGTGGTTTGGTGGTTTGGTGGTTTTPHMACTDQLENYLAGILHMFGVYAIFKGCQ